MGKLWSATSFVALTLLSCLAGTELEAQNRIVRVRRAPKPPPQKAQLFLETNSEPAPRTTPAYIQDLYDAEGNLISQPEPIIPYYPPWTDLTPITWPPVLPTWQDELTSGSDTQPTSTRLPVWDTPLSNVWPPVYTHGPKNPPPLKWPPVTAPTTAVWPQIVPLPGPAPSPPNPPPVISPGPAPAPSPPNPPPVISPGPAPIPSPPNPPPVISPLPGPAPTHPVWPPVRHPHPRPAPIPLRPVWPPVIHRHPHPAPVPLPPVWPPVIHPHPAPGPNPPPVIFPGPGPATNPPPVIFPGPGPATNPPPVVFPGPGPATNPPPVIFPGPGPATNPPPVVFPGPGPAPPSPNPPPVISPGPGPAPPSPNPPPVISPGPGPAPPSPNPPPVISPGPGPAPPSSNPPPVIYPGPLIPNPPPVIYPGPLIPNPPPVIGPPPTPNVQTVPAPYLPPQQSTVHTCNVVNSQRVACGLPGITANACNANGCCFDGQMCYYGKAVTVQCTKDGQFIVVIARDATLPRIDLTSISLLGSGPDCVNVDSNSGFAIYQFPVTACGTTVTEGPGVISYVNRMVSTYDVGNGPYGSITRDSYFELSFQCKYIGSAIKTVYAVVKPSGDLPLPVAALGPITVQLRLANGQCATKGCNEVEVAYNSYYVDTDYPINKVLRDPVYVEVQLTDKTDPNLILTLGRCWATTSPLPHSFPQWDILVNGCPYTNDLYMSTLVTVDASSGVDFPTHYRRFVFKMFTFVDPSSKVHLQQNVYIHCSTAVCTAAPGSSCEPSCGRKKRHATAENQENAAPKIVVSSGPVTMRTPEN